MGDGAAPSSAPEPRSTIIGCFNGSRDLEEVKMEASGMAGVQQMQSYYYIDNVSVVPVEAKSQCSCSGSSSPPTSCKGLTLPSDTENDTVVGRRRSTTLSSSVPSRRTARPVSTVWPASSTPVVVRGDHGHCDNDEVSEGKINPRFEGRSGRAVKRYLVSQGVSDGQPSVGVEMPTWLTKGTDIGVQEPRHVPPQVRRARRLDSDWDCGSSERNLVGLCAQQGTF